MLKVPAYSPFKDIIVPGRLAVKEIHAAVKSAPPLDSRPKLGRYRATVSSMLWTVPSLHTFGRIASSSTTPHAEEDVSLITLASMGSTTSHRALSSPLATAKASSPSLLAGGSSQRADSACDDNKRHKIKHG